MAIAAVVVPAAGASLPTPPSTSDPSNFDARADAFFTALPGLQTSENALAANVYLNAQGVYANTVEVANNTATVASNLAAIVSYANAPLWVSAQVYTVGLVRMSPLDGRLYRCIVLTTVGDTTDPKNDLTKWTIVSPAQAALLVSGLVQQATSGSTYAFSNVAAQSAATNLLLYSSQFDNAAWFKNSVTVTGLAIDATMSPTGDTNADKLVEVAATSIHYTSQSVTTAANQPYTFSIALKAAGRTTAALRLDKDGTGSDAVKAKFDLTTGATSAVANLGAATGASATSTYLGNGWWLCSLSGTPHATVAGTFIRAAISINDLVSYAGDGTSGVYVAQAQLETGSVYTSRIDTGAAQVTRSVGVVAPSRLVLPASPAADAYVSLFVTNAIDTNVVDGNGQTIMGEAKPFYIDSKYPPKLNFQFVNGSWRI
jgi:hypothetical protein